MSKIPKNRQDTVPDLPSDLTQAVVISERRRREIQRLSGVGFWELEHMSGKLYWSEEVYAIYGLDQQEIKPSYDLFVSLIHDSDRELVHTSYQNSVSTGTEYNIRYRIKAKGLLKWIEARGVTYYDLNGKPERSIGTAQDISEIKATHEKIEHMAFHDMLTGLANRKVFTDKLNEYIKLARQNNTNFAVLFIDIDNFKSINDQYGHDIGDEVIVGVANILQGCTREGEMFARIGGDEFAGVIFGINDSEINNSVSAVKNAIDTTYKTKINDFKISASIGVTIYPQDAVDPDILLRHADHAMYEAKEQGKSRIRYFDTDRFLSIASRRHLLKDIRVALNSDQFELYYQPRVQLSDECLAGAEALLRWFRPQGEVPPGDVIAAIKNTPEEWELDIWVIKTVLLNSKLFKESGLVGPFSLNINPSTIENPNFPNLLKTLLSEQNVAGEDVEIEILEVESIKNLNATRKILHECEGLGVSFSLDDFGTGYSSLTHFHALPISKLKVDQSFIKNINSNSDSLLLVKSILAIANANNKPVIAEGIESDSTLQTLAQLKCEYGQGYNIAKPMPVEKYIAWAQSWQGLAHKI